MFLLLSIVMNLSWFQSTLLPSRKSFGTRIFEGNFSQFTCHKMLCSYFYFTWVCQLIVAANLTKVKSKLRSACDKYSGIKVPYKYQNVVANLRKNRDIVILQQDKGRGVVMMESLQSSIQIHIDTLLLLEVDKKIYRTVFERFLNGIE